MNEAYRRLAEDGFVDQALYQTDPIYHALVYRLRIIDKLADHLQDAIHDLADDWEPGGPRMRYEEARALLRSLGR